MRLFVIAVPAAREIEYKYYAKPDKVNATETEAHIIRLEHNRPLVRVIYLVSGVPGYKKDRNRCKPDKVPMAQVIKEWHIAIHVQDAGKFVLDVLG